MNKTLMQLVTSSGIIIMIISGIMFVNGDGLVTDMEFFLLAVDVALLGLIGQVANMTQDTSEKRIPEETQ